MVRIFRGIGIAAIVLGLVGTIGWFNRWHLAYGVVMPLMISPGSPFPTNENEPLDYGNDALWAALPWRGDDPSDGGPEGFVPSIEVADVFYIHPTTYLSADAWNVPVEGFRNTRLLESLILREQPKAFNACCRVFVPYYRQATFYAFMTRKPDGMAAIDAAYDDVRDAFRYFVANWSDGRPFIVAGHSQGSLHAQRLIAEEIMGTELESRFVVAYVPGYQLPVEALGPVCSRTDQTGCLLTWNNVTTPYWLPPFMYDLPLVGEEGYSREPLGEFICAPPAPDAGRNYSAYHAGDNDLSPSAIAGQCVGEFFVIDDPLDPDYGAFPMSRGWWHVYEYAHMWVAIGEDAERRIGAHASD